jgi:hypothetical protein
LIRFDREFHSALFECGRIAFRCGLTHRTPLSRFGIALVSVCPAESSHINTAAYTRKQTHILLPVEANGPHGSGVRVAQAYHWHGNTGRTLRQRWVAPGLAAALVRSSPGQPSRQRRLEGANAAHVMARRCRPPTGVAQWTLTLYADTLVALRVVETIASSTVRQPLPKTRASRTGNRGGSFPRRPRRPVWPPWTRRSRSLRGCLKSPL